MPLIAYVAYVLGGALIAGLSAAFLSACPTPSPRDGKKPDGGTDGDRYDVDGNDVGDFRCGGDSFICDGGIDANTDVGDVGGDGPIDSGFDGGADGDGPVERDGGDEICDAGFDGGPDGDGAVDGSVGRDGGVDGGIDGGVDADGGVDGGIDGGPDGGNDGGGNPIPGVNFEAATFTGPIADLDTEGSNLIAYGGSPAAVFGCQVNGLDPATCQIKAELPSGIDPINYFSTPFGYAIANGAPSDDGNPIDVLKIDENASDPAQALLGQKIISKIMDLASGWFYTPAFPRGIAAYHDLQPERDRFFIATANSTTNSVMGTIICFADEYGDWANFDLPIIVQARGTSALATTKINLNGGEKTFLVALNSGKIDASDAYTAGLSVFDPEAEDPGYMFIKSISLGEVACSMMPELALDAAGKKAYVAIEAPEKDIATIDLETDAISYMSLGSSVQGKIVDMVVDGAKAYIADSSGRVVVADLSLGQVEGYLPLPAAPTALAVVGGIVYAAHGHKLASIDPAQAQLQQ